MKKGLQKAFTLIELLVVISIILLISSIGLISYSSINKKQKVIQQAKNIASMIQLTQNYTISQKKPTGSCPALSGYIYSFNKSNNNYDIKAKCGATEVGVRSGTVSSGVTVDNDFTITFFVQTKGTEFTLDGDSVPDGIKIPIGDSSYQNYLIICKGGVIKTSETDPGSSYCP